MGHQGHDLFFVGFNRKLMDSFKSTSNLIKIGEIVCVIESQNSKVKMNCGVHLIQLPNLQLREPTKHISISAQRLPVVHPTQYLLGRPFLETKVLIFHEILLQTQMDHYLTTHRSSIKRVGKNLLSQFSLCLEVHLSLYQFHL